MNKTKKIEHGIREAFYNGLPGPKPQPVLVCLCGFRAQEHSWEEAGAALDEHLAKVSR